MAQWLTTAQVLRQTDLAVTQQAIKKAAKREYTRCLAAGTIPECVRKNTAGHWEIRDDWEMFRSWQRRGADRAAQVNARHEQAEELSRLRTLCAEQAKRIEALETALADLRGGKGTQADDGESVRGTVPADIFTDDAALLRYWQECGKPSRRALGEQIGKSKSWAAEHLKKALAAA